MRANLSVGSTPEDGSPVADTRADGGSRPRWSDQLLLGAFCFTLFVLAILPGRVLSGHQAVIPETSREMLADHDWLVPKLDGVSWLERPPLSAWWVAAVSAVCGTTRDDRVARLAAITASVPTVLLVAWIGGVFLGRELGLLAGLVFATFQEFYAYATNPEADVFLCFLVTAALAVFVRLEFVRGSPASGESQTFLGRRPWTVFAFFLLLGSTNLAKGLFFGAAMVSIPVVAYLAWSPDRRAIRRYVWLWGWLACLAVSLAWPLFVLRTHPQMLTFWKAHYLGRLGGGFLDEPFWYYALALPGDLMPWTPLAVSGLWLARRGLVAPGSPERFLWSWALAPPLVLSFADGKHHHYLLHCLAPWAILAAPAALRLRRMVLGWPSWLRNPAWTVPAFGLPLAVAAVLFRHQIRGPQWVPPMLVGACVATAFGAAFFVTRRSDRVAIAGTFAVLGALFTLLSAYQARYVDDYDRDVEFLREAQRIVPADRPFLAYYDARELENFWLLYYSEPRVQLVAGSEAIRARHPRAHEVYVLARRIDERDLARIGRTEEILASEHTRSERNPLQRRVLYRLAVNAPPPRKRVERRDPGPNRQDQEVFGGNPSNFSPPASR
ncbi:MAG: hypothetical protein QOD06_2295 [Candidatus Binatota bacterium]|nr:hypothetical protein [Candidatus Binatota bacterium]